MAISPVPAIDQGDHRGREGQRLTGARILCECLLREGVDVFFGYPGGVVLPFYNVLLDYPLRHILVRHEQAAAHAADGYARVTGKVGVCMATSGPGATNLVTGIASAMMDSVPMVALTGNVPTSVLGTDAFQETDIFGITLPITKHNFLVTVVEDLAHTIKEAFHLARTGRPGPIVVDIPKDVFLTEAVFHYPETVNLRGYKPTIYGNAKQVKAAAELINQAQRPLILAGHGISLSGAHDELRELAEKANIPITTTLLGIGTFPESHPLSLAMPGMHGAAYSNLAINECDVLIGVGSRFDDRITGKVSEFAPKAKVIHIDIDPAEIGKSVKVSVPIVGDARAVLQALNREVRPAEHTEWIAQIDEWRAQMPLTHIRETDKLLPQHAIRAIWEVCGGNAYVATDVGQHQMWVAQHWFFDKKDSHITSGGLGAMGFGLPAAMGVKVGQPNETTWAIVGDGGFMMTMQELATLAAEGINVKCAIINNAYLGMIKQWQDLFYQKRYSSSYLGTPDFVKLAEAFHIKGIRIDSRDELLPKLREAQEHDGPVLVDIHVDPDEHVYPMIPSGGTIQDMLIEPHDLD